MIIAIAINCIKISELKASSTHTGACTFVILVTQPEYARFDTDWETAIHISSVKSPFTLDKSGSPTNLVLVVGTWALVSTCGYILHICHFFTRAKFLENKIYTEKTRKLRQNTQKIAIFCVVWQNTQ